MILISGFREIIWCGLQADAKENGEVLKIDQMEDLLDQAESFGHIVDAMNKAFSTAFQRTEKEKN